MSLRSIGKTLALIGCGLFAGASLAENGVSEGELKIGMVNAQTGPAAGLGTGMRSGAEAVFKKVNAGSGIFGRKINLIVADDGYEPNRAVDETLKMIEEQKVFALFGYVGTPTANAILPIVKDSKIPIVALFTGAMSLRAPVTPEVFNIRASYDDEAEALVAAFVKKGAQTFGVFHQDDGFGLAVLSGTEKALKKRGLAVSAKGTFQRNTTAIRTGLAAMLEAKPDAVIMVGPYTPVALFIKEARSSGLKSQLGTVSFVGTDNLVAAVGAEGDGVVISQVVPFPADITVPVTKACGELVEKYSNQKLGFVNLEGCISAKILVAALEKLGKDATREGLIKALEGFKASDIDGLAIDLGPGQHQALSQVFMTVIQGGRIAKTD